MCDGPQPGLESNQTSAIPAKQRTWTEVARGRINRLVAHVRRYLQRACAGYARFGNETRPQAMRTPLPCVDTGSFHGPLDDPSDGPIAERLDSRLAVIPAGEQRAGRAAADLEPRIESPDGAGEKVLSERHCYFTPSDAFPILLLAFDEDAETLLAECEILEAARSDWIASIR